MIRANGYQQGNPFKRANPFISSDGGLTLTGGGAGENHKGMEILGTPRKNGFTFEELETCEKIYKAAGYECELIHLHEALPAPLQEEADKAWILVVRNGVSMLTDADKLYSQVLALKWDRRAKMRGRVVNKHARWNLVFMTGKKQLPDYEAGKGTIYDIDGISHLAAVRDGMPTLVGDKAKGFIYEGNWYYDVSKCGIGFHGDTERKCVVALRLGASMPLVYEWYRRSKTVGGRIELSLDHGDLYVMSEKATGFDWLKQKPLTLRHAAGCKKYTTPKVPATKRKKPVAGGSEQKKICV